MEFIPAALIAGITGTARYWSYLDKMEKKELVRIEEKNLVPPVPEKSQPVMEEKPKISQKVEKKSRYAISFPELEDENIFKKGELITPAKQPQSRGVEYPTEKKCREIFEKIFNLRFPKRWDIIKNPRTGRWLELDGYSENLRLCWEYNGEQHYTYPHPYWKNVNEFKRSIYRDRIKVIVCKKLEIDLIVIPHTEKKKLEKFILNQLKEVAKHNKLVAKRLKKYVEGQ